MKIYTSNKAGQRIEVEYTQRLLEEPEEKPEIIINDYPTYKKCVIESNNQQQYTPDCRDLRFERALGELSRRDRNLYKNFCQKLHEEYSRK